MHVNYEYLLAKSESHCSSEGRILDYGCGAGDVVSEGRKRDEQYKASPPAPP